MAGRPLCFVLLPFGANTDPAGGPDFDFDTIYERAIRPGIEDAGLEPIRAGEERTGGIPRTAFERLLLCDFAVADLTTANANVFYELGVRHAARPATTLAVFSARHPPPFDLNYVRCLPYELAEGNRCDEAAAARLRAQLTERLTTLREVATAEAASDSAIFQLLSDYHPPDLARLKTDTFRDRVRYSSSMKRRLAQARRAGSAAAVSEVEGDIGPLDAVEAGVLVDLFLSYRAVSAHEAMVTMYERLPAVLRRSVLVREQLAFALNRLKRHDEALQILDDVIAEQGPSAETCGLIGRIHKDRWLEALANGDLAAAGHLARAIAAYVRGFEADWRDAYPGISAATLLDVKGDAAALAQRDELLPVVRFAVRQRLRAGKPDYWDYATLLELAVLESLPEHAAQALGDALAAIREAWEPETTAGNLSLIRSARQTRGVEQPWLGEVIDALGAASRARTSTDDRADVGTATAAPHDAS